MRAAYPAKPLRLAEMGLNVRQAFEKEFDKRIGIWHWNSLLTDSPR